MNEIALLSASAAFALLCAGIMGYAIQRGATCMVAAVEEIVKSGNTSRLTAMLEAGLWVAIGLLLANATGHLRMVPAHVPIGFGTLSGGALLGVGAWLNRSCVFGSIAKLGSGKWAYVATPVGFFIGCLSAAPLIAHPAAPAARSALFDAGLVLVPPISIYAVWRGRAIFAAAHDRSLHKQIWSPHQATIIIGIAFVGMMLTVGNWAYTQALADAAVRMFPGLPLKLTLFAGLLAGATIGGWTADLIKPSLPTGAEILRCLIGGGLMGAGSMLIPGSNDSLILIGLPLLLPYAFVSLSSMVLAIYVAMVVERWFASTGPVPL